MNFSERLIKLRKENGLSQEELGYKLNVTRQTVSKWELGQTTPEMSKLVEMSKLFGVTLDELTDNKALENESIENNNIEENHNKRNIIIVILLVSILVILVILGINKIYNRSSKEGIFEKVFGDVFDSQDEVMSQAQNLFEDITQVGQNLLNQQTGNQSEQNLINQVTQMGQDLINNSGFNQDVFNSNFELYNGTESGWSVKNLIDEIVTNNKKEKDKIITVIYQGTSISEPKELQSLKTKFEDITKYEVSFEYDENGYIYQTDIMDLN